MAQEPINIFARIVDPAGVARLLRPDTSRNEQVILLTATFRFSLATDFAPDCDPTGDPRLSLLPEMATMTEAAVQRFEFPVVWGGAYGPTICICTGHLVDPSDPNSRVCRIAIDEIRSCRVESDRLSTPQLDLNALPLEVQAEASRLLGGVLDLNRQCVESGLAQYINPP